MAVALRNQNAGPPQYIHPTELPTGDFSSDSVCSLSICYQGTALKKFAYILLAGTASAFAAEAAGTPARSVEALPTVDVQEQQWCRYTWRLSSTGDNSTQLILSSPGTVSVYLNGQRLVRNHSIAGNRIAWTIGKLLRQGVNCLAVAVSAPTKAGILAGSFSASAKFEMKDGSWKVTTLPPPVGWQKTDFNDRDWKVVKSSSNASAAVDKEPVHMNWERATGKSRLSSGRFRFRDGDHVLMLGGTFIERAQEFGHLESALNVSSGSSGLTFRNLGWSADTVFAESRGIFDSPEKGYERMIEHVRAEEPDVIVVCYGQNEAMSFAAGAAGLDRFRRQLAVLYRDLATTGAEIVFLSPHPFLSVEPPLPDPSHWNPRLEEFKTTVGDFAEEVGAGFVDLYTGLSEEIQTIHAHGELSDSTPGNLAEHSELVSARNHMWTDNGIHWNSAGYRRVSMALASRLTGRTFHSSVIEVDLSAQVATSRSGEIRNARWKTSGVSFEFRPNAVTGALLTVRVKETPKSGDIGVSASVPGGQATRLKRNPDMENNATVTFLADENANYEQLRQLTVNKNELYFHRWRPQNITYLFGFRKHEQGNNASEIALFDPLIAELEKQIHEAKQPVWQTITISVK